MKKIIAVALAALALAAPAFAAEKAAKPQMTIYPVIFDDVKETQRVAIEIYRTVDIQTGVICYVTYRGGISCLKDPSLQKVADQMGMDMMNDFFK